MPNLQTLLDVTNHLSTNRIQFPRRETIVPSQRDRDNPVLADSVLTLNVHVDRWHLASSLPYDHHSTALANDTDEAISAAVLQSSTRQSCGKHDLACLAMIPADYPINAFANCHPEPKSRLDVY